MLKNVVDMGGEQDGFRGLKVLQKRFDSVTAASLMNAYLEVVAPTPIKRADELIGGIHRWETKVALLLNRYKEDINDRLKLAIVVGMLPKEYQDLVWQNSSRVKNTTYEESKD